MSQQDIDKLSFEQLYVELEETTYKLEAGNLPLAEAIALYQRGIALAQHCNIQLDKAELSIKEVDLSGALVDFDEL